MMIALLSLGAAVSCFALLYGLIQYIIKPHQDLSQRLRYIDAKKEMEAGSQTSSQNRKKAGQQDKNISFHQRIIIPLRDKLGRWLTNLAPAAWSRELEHKLVLAGKSKNWTVHGYAIFWGLMIIVGAFMGCSHVSRTDDLMVIQSVMLVVIFTTVFALMPWGILRVLIQKRQELILYQLPEVLDLLCVSVQAGLTFDAALRRIVAKLQGPLIDEMKKMLEDSRMGLPRRQAMRMLADRCDVQELTLFCTSLIQAERLGTSIGKTLNNQAANMRERHRQRIKAKAMRAPVKMLFPLVLFIFPAIFVVVLLPSLLIMVENFMK